MSYCIFWVKTDQVRYFLHFSFDGTPFHGWQRQPNAVSVQGEMEDRIGKLNGAPVELVGCGRTDAGVHARSFYAHVDLDRLRYPAEEWLHKLNRMLPAEIAVRDLIPVEPDAHARFDATARTYHYYIHTRKDPFSGRCSLEVNKELNGEAMNQATALLVGTMDYTSFARQHTDVQSHICTVSEALWLEKDGNWVFRITANRFLRNMVRSIVGTSLKIGKGKWRSGDMVQVIEARDRSVAADSAPAHALFLEEVKYPFLQHE